MKRSEIIEMLKSRGIDYDKKAKAKVLLKLLKSRGTIYRFKDSRIRLDIIGLKHPITNDNLNEAAYLYLIKKNPLYANLIEII